ncbi:unnamed protein product [Paramecium octaurelia]|uniref:Uncharacterized protein n=1 Tax=Paramecium octaurelia TaxID=43137 RepID=A0A8S1YIZ3_PAROT|nr:unnamed protein product [Paramecium octaurelia]
MEGYHLERNKKNCSPSCNDGIIEETEECDDKNNIQFDKCYKCQQSCQLECQICIKQKCLACLEGWQLLDDICVPKCGDGIIALGSQEQCDDGNQIDKDGCDKCIWQCSPYCKQCINQNLCDKCIDIVIPGLEECDDGNEVPFDGCFECQFECQISCVKCEFGICQQQCKQDQIIVNGSCKNESDDSSQMDEMEQDENNINNQFSIQECGDGRKSQKEECDDSNNLNNDGCSNICQIEVNWNCKCLQQIFSYYQLEDFVFELKF